MAEFLFKRFDYIHPDPEKDRRGVHKKTDFINWKPDGFSFFSHGNGPGSYLIDFVIVKVPGITLQEAEANDHRKPWKDDFDYEIMAERKAQGEYDIRVFEKNAGAINQNAIAGAKAIKVRDYMVAWGCSNFSLSATDASFTFSLWDAVKSANFWEVNVLQFAGMSFNLNSYSGATGIGDITVTVPEDTQPETVIQKIEQRGGTVTVIAHPSYTFTIERSNILSKFRADVKLRAERIYTRHRYGISQANHDAIVAAGGIVTMTKAEFLSKLIDKTAAV